MSAKDIIFHDSARKKLEAGINKVADAVSTTLGPAGKVVVFGKQFGGPTATKDGVTVAKQVELEDHFENLGAQLCCEVASKTNDDTGDGTTTATVLARAMVNEGMRYVSAGGNAVLVKKGIDKAIDSVVEFIKNSSKDVTSSDEIKFVATIAGNNDEIGAIIANAFDQVGKDGVITLEESKGRETYIDVVDGCHFDKGFVADFFVTQADGKRAELDNPLILVSEAKMNNPVDVLPLLEKLAESRRAFVFISPDFHDDILRTFFKNIIMQRALPPCVLVKAPGFGNRQKDNLEDIAIVTGATFISSMSDIKFSDITLDMLGSADKVVVDKESTVIMNGKGAKESVLSRVDSVKSEISSTESNYDKDKLQERLARLCGGIGKISIGASSDTELQEKKHRYEDSLAATRAAIEGGIVCGGGITLLRASQYLGKSKIKTDSDDEKIGIDIVKNALLAPMRTITSNAGLNGDLMVNLALSKKGNVGYNASTGIWENLVSAGVVDPAKVTLNAVQNSASIAGLVLTTECLINELPKKNQFPPGMMMPDM